MWYHMQQPETRRRLRLIRPTPAWEARREVGLSHFPRR